MSHDNQPVFYKPFFLVVIASLAFMALIAFMITSNNEAQNSASSDGAPAVSEAEVQEIAEVTAPVAEVAVAGSADSAPAAPAAGGGEVSEGQATYDSVCAACHSMGIAGAPKFADEAAWTDRIAQGNETLYSNAINGFTGASGSMMPAKGGRADLSDDAVKAAVDYMLEAVGVESASAEPAPAAATEETAAAAPAAADGKGKEVYDSVCFACHAMGVAGAPKFADAAAWTDRIAKGNDTMYSNAINGFMGEAGLMPPKGGAMDLSDDDVKAAVDYMVANSQ